MDDIRRETPSIFKQEEKPSGAGHFPFPFFFQAVPEGNANGPSDTRYGPSIFELKDFVYRSSHFPFRIVHAATSSMTVTRRPGARLLLMGVGS